jgi:hypothetical protein
MTQYQRFREEGGNMFLQNVGILYKATWCHNLDDHNKSLHHSENSNVLNIGLFFWKKKGLVPQIYSCTNPAEIQQYLKVNGSCSVLRLHAHTTYVHIYINSAKKCYIV